MSAHHAYTIAEAIGTAGLDEATTYNLARHFADRLKLAPGSDDRREFMEATGRAKRIAS